MCSLLFFFAPCGMLIPMGTGQFLSDYFKPKDFNSRINAL